MLDIAWNLPTSEQALADLEGVPPKLVTRVGHEIIDAINQSTNDARDYEPPRPPDEAQKALVKRMQAKVVSRADELGIVAEGLASKRALTAVIIGGTRNSRVFTGWRAELIGNELLELL